MTVLNKHLADHQPTIQRISCAIAVCGCSLLHSRRELVQLTRRFACAPAALGRIQYPPMHWTRYEASRPRNNHLIIIIIIIVVVIVITTR
jgi:hypothetical protein